MTDERIIGEDDDGIRLDRWFQRHAPDWRFADIARAARTGQVRLDGARVATGERLAAGQRLRLPPAPPAQEQRARRQLRALSADEEAFARSLVLHEDAHCLVLAKPPGLATQGGTRTTAHVDGLLGAFAAPGQPQPKLVHRLDKDTSGVLLLARTAYAAAFFARQFAQRETRKVYWALLAGVPVVDDQRVELPLAKQPGTGGEKMHVAPDGLPSVSRIRVVDAAGGRAAFVEMRPHTGRTHQLRVHAAAIGCPVVGDGKYGGADAFLTGGVSRKLHLHARRLVIGLPGGATLDIAAALPPHMESSLELLGFDWRAAEALAPSVPAVVDRPGARPAKPTPPVKTTRRPAGRRGAARVSASPRRRTR